MLKTILPLTTITALLAAPAFAVSLADLGPTALPGKTLELTFEGGDSASPLTGTWTIAFNKTPANSVTINNFPGQGAADTTTWTYAGAPFPDSHGYTFASTAAFGNKAADITLWISVSGIRFYLTIDGESNYGGAVFKSSAAADIAVQQPAGSDLTDGAAKKSFGTVKIGGKGATKTFTIKNTGTAKLTGLALRKSGTNKGDFVVGAPDKTALAPGASVKFSVTFKPKPGDKRKRAAAIAISSNDADESPFDIELAGEGVK